MERCYARTCGTCWVCTAAAEQVRAIAERRWTADWKPTLVMTSPPCWLTPRGQIVDAPADVQARALAARDRADAPEHGRRSGNVSVGYSMADDTDQRTEEHHGSQNGTEAVAPCGTSAHPLVGPEGQQSTDRAGAELAICPGPNTSGGPCPSP